MLLPDFELREVSRSLSIVADLINGAESISTHFQLMQRLILLDDDEYKPAMVGLARIVAAKPHSMDVERLVSSYNLIKSTDRSSLSGETLQDYLIVRHNMPCIAKLDVRQVVEEWMSKLKEIHGKIGTLQNSCTKSMWPHFLELVVLMTQQVLHHPKSSFEVNNYCCFHV